MALELVDDDFMPCADCVKRGLKAAMCTSCEKNLRIIEDMRKDLFRERRIVDALIRNQSEEQI